MTACTTICTKCCTLHICGRHPKCLRELSEERRAELMAGWRRSVMTKATDATFVARVHRDAAKERELAGWLRDFSVTGEPDHEFTVEAADRALAVNLPWAERFDAARRGVKL